MQVPSGVLKETRCLRTGGTLGDMSRDAVPLLGVAFSVVKPENVAVGRMDDVCRWLGLRSDTSWG